MQKRSALFHTTLSLFVIVAATAIPAVGTTFPSPRATPFDAGSLLGSYASVGDAGSGVSVSVGTATFDGRGGVTRALRINAEDPAGGRRLIEVSAEGSYTVNADGTGTLTFSNEVPGGATSSVTFDFVITRSGNPSLGGSPAALELFGVQREPGVTASPVVQTYTRR